MNRRVFVRRFAVAFAPIMAGCYPDYSAGSRLTIDEVTATESTDGYELTLVVENHNVRNNADADFHDVTVLGYGPDGALVCEKHIGTVSHEFDNNNGKSVTLECSKYPHQLTFTAEESPCEDDVIIDVAVYRPDSESWLYDRYQRECGEGLPPTPGDG